MQGAEGAVRDGGGGAMQAVQEGGEEVRRYGSESRGGEAEEDGYEGFGAGEED